METPVVHVGVKGMKWGVRRAYLNRISRANTRTSAHIERMRNGEATVKDMLRFIGDVRVDDIVRGSTGFA